MEGSDDTTLDPGEIVKLVRVEPSTGALRVRTQDDNHFEGVVPASYLRRRDLVKAGARMECKFMLHPACHTLTHSLTHTHSHSQTDDEASRHGSTHWHHCNHQLCLQWLPSPLCGLAKRL